MGLELEADFDDIERSDDKSSGKELVLVPFSTVLIVVRYLETNPAIAPAVMT
jgi:hypothetical protein